MMPRTPRTRLLLLSIAGLALGAMALSRPAPAAPDDPIAPSWIWMKGDPKDGQTVRFRKTFETPAGVTSAQLVVACDNDAVAMIDGRIVARCSDWSAPVAKDASEPVVGTGRNRGKAGKHVLTVVGKNEGGPAGLIVRLTIKTKDGRTQTVVSDGSWKVADSAEARGWMSPNYDDAKWAMASVVAPLGGGPWTGITAARLDSASTNSNPVAPDPSGFRVAKGFKVERLYTVPKDEQGSWVNMTVDPKGRLIVSDQYGKLYRVTPPAIGETGEPKIEPITAPIGEAQGLLWAFDSLYVVVNRGERYDSGLYRVTDSDGNDQLDKVEKLRGLDGGGEHGPHAVILSPDQKSLYVVAGNATKLTEVKDSLVPRIYDEDQILPYMTDGNGFMANERAPGGWICRVTPDGKDWTLVSMGFRNPFDIAFNKHGDLFTYDSDMEWDINTPWYRPTRVCQADSGSDLGYRNGSGKWPTYYPDSLPPTLNIGPGSPTGIVFGYDAKTFPSKYREALFICDWSYGKLYAVHMTPEDSHYKAEAEEFITGSPLPLTDVVVNPKDGAMYFAIGGRKTLSGLYRVTASVEEEERIGKASDPGAEARALRRSLEAFHGKKDPKAVETAWPHLGHRDRFIRYAARVAIEFQDVKSWADKALAESNPQAALTALLALSRCGGHEYQTPLIHGLGKLDWDSLDLEQKLSALRVLELAIIRMGDLDADLKEGLSKHLGQMVPARSRELNAELVKILVRLEAPDAAQKAMALLATAPTQEEQMEYVTALRKLRTGWTPELRKAYFQWFQGANRFRGGASLNGFLRQMKNDAMQTLSDEEKTALKPVLDAPVDAGRVAPKAALAARPVVKEWRLDDLAPGIEGKLKGRDYDKGRALFGTALCFNCHRYNNEGGAVGPDLSLVSGRFGPRDLLESILVPSKEVSDQYRAITVATADGRVITGRVVNLNGDNMMINTDMLDPNAMTGVNRNQIEETKPSTVSMMPEGLLNTFKEDEILDLLAFLLSRGDRKSPMFGH